MTAHLDTSTNADSAADVLLETILGEITAVVRRVSASEIDAVAEAIDRADHVLVAGEGRSGFMARAFAMRLMHLGVNVHVIGETTTPAVRAGDTVVAVSGSGTTPATVRVVDQAVACAARVLAVTTDPSSPMASRAGADGLTLHIPAATKYRRAGEAPTVQPLSSLFDQATHLVLDTVCLLIAERRKVDNTAAASRHANTE
jgi:6-phospho-3-hexuloisomerase